MLSLPVAFDGSGMSLAIALLVTGMLVSPLLAAFAHDLGVEGIGTNFSPGLIPLSLTLTGRLAANLLLGMVRGRLPVSVNDNGIITGEKFVPIPSTPRSCAKAARSGETSIPVTRSAIARLIPEPSNATGSDSISVTKAAASGVL